MTTGFEAAPPLAWDGALPEGFPSFSGALGLAGAGVGVASGFVGTTSFFMLSVEGGNTGAFDGALVSSSWARGLGGAAGGTGVGAGEGGDGGAGA